MQHNCYFREADASSFKPREQSDNVARLDRDLMAAARPSPNPVETVIGCQLQSRWARATYADPRYR
jgi:hypothetical protein